MAAGTTVRIAYPPEEDDVDWMGIYIDDDLFIEGRVYDFTPFQIIQFLHDRRLLREDVQYDEIEIELPDPNYVKLPEKLIHE